MLDIINDSCKYDWKTGHSFLQLSISCLLDANYHFAKFHKDPAIRSMKRRQTDRQPLSHFWALLRSCDLSSNCYQVTYDKLFLFRISLKSVKPFSAEKWQKSLTSFCIYNSYVSEISLFLYDNALGFRQDICKIKHRTLTLSFILPQTFNHFLIDPR